MINVPYIFYTYLDLSDAPGAKLKLNRTGYLGLTPDAVVLDLIDSTKSFQDCKGNCLFYLSCKAAGGACYADKSRLFRLLAAVFLRG
ncbi:MAG: hypothetical protein L6405_03170 [Actinomycetia bacterium]|nr:hypothetical protein [Actinomycetota bacterium]MCG2710988.1 hypothetical protein [Candidatus Omnitrophota bacterium]MCG2788937.1 hypothetical protein [Actinomycetes bacterium]